MDAYPFPSLSGMSKKEAYRDASLKSSRSRAVTALYRGTPDRVPCVPLIDLSYAASVRGIAVSDCFGDPVTHAQALESCLLRHPDIDGLSINLTLCDEVTISKTQVADGWQIETVGGLTWNVPQNDVGSVNRCEITSFDDPRLSEDDPLRPGVCRTLRNMSSKVLQDYLVIVGVTGPFSQVAFLMGLDCVLMAMIDNPKGLLRAIEKRVPLTLEWIEEVASFNPSSIWIGEGFASASLISPEAYRKFVRPFEKIAADAIRRHNIPSVLHICGKCEPILGDVSQAGFDCFELDWQVDISKAKDVIGDNMSLKGNINTTTLLQESPATIYDISKDLIDKAAKGGGFVLSSGCCVGRDTPAENIGAMARAAIDHGKY